MAYIKTRRRNIFAAIASVAVIALGMTGDFIFGVFPKPVAIPVWASAVVLASGLVIHQFTTARRAQRAAEGNQTVRPQELPRVKDVIGHAALIDALSTRLQEVSVPRGRSLPVDPSAGLSTIEVIHGTPGVGKTAIALTVAHRVIDSYSDGQLYADLRGDEATPKAAGDVLKAFLASLGATEIPARVDDRAARFRSLTNDLRLLVVLDNVSSTEQIRPLIPVGAGCSVVVTSRRAVLSDETMGRHVTQLSLPDESEALDVLAHFAGASRVAAEYESAVETVRFCGRLPLALQIVGAKLKSRPDLTMRQMVIRLRDERTRVGELEHDDKSLHACLSLAFGELDAASKATLAAIAALPAGHMADWHFRHLVPERVRATAVTDELLATSLMEARSDGDSGSIYHMHDLIRVFAAEQFERIPPEERREYERRLVQAYRDMVVHAAAARAPELSDGEDQVSTVTDTRTEVDASWVFAEQERLKWAVAKARRLEMYEVAAETAEAISYFLDDVTLSVAGANWIFDGAAEARPRVVRSLLRARAAAALSSGDPREALELLSARRAERAEDAAERVALARDRMVVARAHAASGDYMQGLEQMTSAVAGLRSSSDAWHMLSALERLGELQRWTGSPEDAEHSQREALRIAKALGDRQAHARVSRTLGETLGYLRRSAEASLLLEAALREYRMLGDRVWEGATLYALGKIYRLLGRRPDALSSYERAEDIFGPMGEDLWVGRIQNARVRVLEVLGRRSDALEAAHEADHIFIRLDSEMWRAHNQRDIGWLFLRHGSPEEALDPLGVAISWTERASDVYAGAMAHHLRGVAFRELGQFGEAHRDFDVALKAYTLGSYEWNVAAVIHDVVRALHAEGRTADADRLASATVSSNTYFARLEGRDGARAAPDEDH